MQVKYTYKPMYTGADAGESPGWFPLVTQKQQFRKSPALPTIFKLETPMTSHLYAGMSIRPIYMIQKHTSLL